MGNLRSVAQAVIHVATDTARQRAVITLAPRRWCAPPIAWCCRGRAPCRLHARAARIGPARIGAGGGRHQAAVRRLRGHADAAGPQRRRPHGGRHAGPGPDPGEVLKFELAGQPQPDGSRFKVPQMGWNRGAPGQPHPVWGSVPDGELVLFRAQLLRAAVDARHSVGEAEYGARFTAAVARDNIFATQFHPEKSAIRGWRCTATSCTGTLIALHLLLF
jgi:glutamine amidotransferase